MGIQLDHTIVPSRDQEQAARAFAHLFGLHYEGPGHRFSPVRVNEVLTLDFHTEAHFEPHHYAFRVSEAEFDAIFARIRAGAIAYGSGPRSADDKRISTRHGGRAVYFHDRDGHLLEILTA